MFQFQQLTNIFGDIYDIGSYLKNNITIDENTKYKLLTQHWKPPKNFNFPYSKHIKKGKEEKRFLRVNHLETYFWLVYSKESKGLYCLYCSIFVHTNIGCGNKNHMPLKTLVTEPLIHFAKLLGKQSNLETHEKNQYHIKAIQDGQNFVKSFNNPKTDIINQLDSHRLKIVKENRERLKPIITTIIFLGKQNIPIRGHRDNGSIFDNHDKPLGNEGNFRELLKFRMESGDLLLKLYFEHTGANATYISKTTQNELIFIIGDLILQKILTDVNNSPFFSIMFDETTDMAHISQLVLVIRYIKDKIIREDFIGFIDVHRENFNSNDDEPKMSGTLIGDTVLNILKKFSLNLDNCIGISTDSCATMVGLERGAVTTLQNDLKFAVKCPCFNHALNNSLIKGCKVQSIRNTFGTISEVVAFFNSSAKRTFVLNKYLGHSLHSLCQTRWVEKHDSILQFSTSLVNIVKSLDSISEWSDTVTSSKAHNLSKALTCCEFIVSLHSISNIFSVTSPISRLLQSKNQDKLSATNIIQSVLSTLKTKRQNSVDVFAEIFEICKSNFDELNISLTLPRLGNKMLNRANPKVKSPDEFYRVAIFLPFIDNIICDLANRFSKEVVEIFDLDLFLPDVIIKVFLNKYILGNKIQNIMDKFGEILIKHLSYSKDSINIKLAGEIELWHEFWINKNKIQSGEIPKTAIDLLEYCEELLYPCISILIQILSVLPASTSSAERCFSLFGG